MAVHGGWRGRAQVAELASVGLRGPHAAAARHALATAPDARAVVLVEGISDRCALLAVAERRGRDLDAERVAVLPMGGASNIATFVDAFGPHGLDVQLAGLCDAAEEPLFRRALERAGLGAGLDRDGMAALGFHVCVADLEDELIRAVGAGAVQELIGAQGELGSFRSFQRQPAQRARAVEQQLHRFVGTQSGRKATYARLLAEALDPSGVPAPLDGVLACVRRTGR